MTKLFSPAGHRWAGSDHGRWEPAIDRAALREEAIHADAELRASEWLEDWEIIENHVRSGDCTISRQVAELIVAAARAPRGAHRDRTCGLIGELFLADLRESLVREAVAQLEQEGRE